MAWDDYTNFDRYDVLGLGCGVQGVRCKGSGASGVRCRV